MIKYKFIFLLNHQNYIVDSLLKCIKYLLKKSCKNYLIIFDELILFFLLLQNITMRYNLVLEQIYF